MEKQVEFTMKLRDACKVITDIANEFLELSAAKEKNQLVADSLESTFTVLHFEPLQGAKLGDYEVAYKPNNAADKWSRAYNVLKTHNATIKDRFHGEGYQYSYWLYVEDKIYRQKLKPKG
jgi:hypothetical protein